MKIHHIATLALLSVFCAPAASAADLKSGVAVGGSIGTYKATKCGGIDDGIKVGASLCYT